ncbi:hypothetical protein MJC1_02161 [Methylocystis sp. MJC1]|nr:hypothetical protein MJC1_02161 [Methylocystis sp. MJC1]
MSRVSPTLEVGPWRIYWRPPSRAGRSLLRAALLYLRRAWNCNLAATLLVSKIRAPLRLRSPGREDPGRDSVESPFRSVSWVRG